MTIFDVRKKLDPHQHNLNRKDLVPSESNHLLHRKSGKNVRYNVKKRQLFSKTASLNLWSTNSALTGKVKSHTKNEPAHNKKP